MRLPSQLAPRVLDLVGPASAPYHPESDRVRRRRRLIVGATLVVGTVLLGLALTRPAGSTAFYVLAAVLAAVWLAGGLLSGPLHLGRSGDPETAHREIVTPILAGVLAFAIFALGAVAVSWIPSLHHAVIDVISRADKGSRSLVVAITIVNGISEEVFFRGALYSAFGRHRPALWTTVCYVAVTAAAGNVMLVLAAALMGTLFALERRATRGILAPALTHIVWSTLMIFLLPR